MTPRESALKRSYLKDPILTGSTRRMKVDFWRARELIGEEAAAKIWGGADADQDEVIEIDVPVHEGSDA